MRLKRLKLNDWRKTNRISSFHMIRVFSRSEKSFIIWKEFLTHCWHVMLSHKEEIILYSILYAQNWYCYVTAVFLGGNLVILPEILHKKLENIPYKLTKLSQIKMFKYLSQWWRGSQCLCLEWWVEMKLFLIKTGNIDASTWNILFQYFKKVGSK